MSENKLDAELHKLAGESSTVLHKLKRYGLLMFIVLVASIYGFVLWRVNVLNSAEPTSDAVTSQVKAARLPRIDQSVVSQLETLRDNSVNVQALFDQARNNPFQ